MNAPAATALPDRPRLRSFAAVLALVVAVALAYHNTFDVPFLLDDDGSIRDNPSIRGFRSAWSPPPGGNTVSGRPLVNVSLALNHALGGLDVRGYHAFNLLVHVAAGVFLFGIVHRVLRLPRWQGRFEPDALLLALAAALAWALHPLLTESVTYIVQRAESMAGMLCLATLYCFLRAAAPGASAAWLWCAWLACLAGMATKEVMATAPVIVLLFDRVFLADSWAGLWRARGRRHLALAATWLLLAWLVLATGTRGGTAGFGTAFEPLDYARTQVAAVMHYLRLAFWPDPLVFDYGLPMVASLGEIPVSTMLLAGLLAATAWGLWRNHPLGFCGATWFLALAPSSSVVPVSTQTMNEHRVYLALAAVAVPVVLLLYRGLGRRAFWVLPVLLVALGVATERRNALYRSDRGLWEDTLQKRPGNMRALLALASIADREGRTGEALGLLQQALAIQPAAAPVHNDLGNVLQKLGHVDEAIASFETALRLGGEQATVLNNLGNALQQAGREADAVARLDRALALEPDLPGARFNLANALARTGRLPEAVLRFEEHLRRQPVDAEACSNLGDVLFELGRTAEGIARLEQAVGLQPGRADLHNNLGVALARSGRPAEALRAFEEAVRLRPDFTEARQNAARAAAALPRR